jgi:hypothetical protein
MNKKGSSSQLLMTLFLILLVLLLYFYTDETKDIIHMISSETGTIDFDSDNNTVNVQFADASEAAYAVLVGDEVNTSEVINNESILEIVDGIENYADKISSDEGEKTEDYVNETIDEDVNETVSETVSETNETNETDSVPNYAELII